MDQHVRLALIGALLLVPACGRKPPRPEPLQQPAPAAKVVPGLDAYDRNGNLKGSATRVEWLELPAAFKRSEARSFEAHEVYEAEGIRFDKMCDFLSKRMFTGKVELKDDRARYEAVIPLDMNEKASRLNVLLTQEAGKLTLDIERLPRLDVKPLSDEEARQLLSKEAERQH